MNHAKTLPVLLAGLLASAGAFAQTTGVLVVPADTTVITTTTEMGAPAAPMVQDEARVVPRNSATATSNIPVKAGEASTMTNGVPNMLTYNPDPDPGRVVRPKPMEVARIPQKAGEVTTMVNGRPNWNPDDPLIRQEQRERAMGAGAAQPAPGQGGTPD